MQPLLLPRYGDVRSVPSYQINSLSVVLSRPEKIVAVLAGNRPSQLLGTPESSQIDFKKQPYDLGKDKGRWELAKDVAGLANLDGGVLVIGVRTEKTPGNFLEIAAELRPVPVDRLDKEKHHGIIRDIVRPAVVFEIRYFPDPDETDKGYMIIHVEPLDEADRWALVRRMVNNEDKLVDSIGVPIRDSDQTRWLSSDEVYQHLRDGQRASRTFIHVPELESTRSLGPEDALQRLISFKDWESPVIAWQSLPDRSVDLSTRMWGKGSIAQALRDHPPLRPYGFNWYFMTEPAVLDNGVLASDGRHAIWVREDGMVTAAASVKEDDMLTWAMRNPPSGPYRLNSVALIEMTLEYYRLVDKFVLPGTNTHYMHVVSTRNFAGESAVILRSGLPAAIVASEHQLNRDIQSKFRASSYAEYDAYQALARLYAAFQFGAESIPFAAEEQIDTRKLVEYANAH
jgi:hypothetical protein